MKTKIILIAIAAATLGAMAGLVAPRLSSPAATAAGEQKVLYYACPMHPDKHYDKAGDCPICGMKLQPVYTATNAPALAATSSCCGTTCPMNSRP